MLKLTYHYFRVVYYMCLVDLSAFDLEREREWRQRENALKVQIAQLEATLKSDVGEKGSILDRLTSENGTFHGESCCASKACVLLSQGSCRPLDTV